MQEKKPKNLFNLLKILIIFFSLVILTATIYFFDPTIISTTFDLMIQFWPFVPKIIVSIIILIIFIIIFSIYKYTIIKSKLFFDDRNRPGLLKLSKIIFGVIYCITIIFLFFKNLDALITSIGLIGLGLTFALQKPVMNFVGWLTITTKDIYSEGDRVKIGTIKGDVKEIQIMNTVLYGFLEKSEAQSQKIITLPNDLVLTTEVENYSKNSNYVLEELQISITYESNYIKAMKLLESIIIKNLKTNIKNYIKRETKKKLKVEFFLDQFQKKKIDHQPITIETAKSQTILEKEKETIEKKIEDLAEMEEEFKPKIRLEMADSYIVLSAQFLTPYKQIIKNRSEINIAFLDALKKEKDIEVAYPHMELVFGKKEKKFIESLKNFQ
ncbi:MAG: mechanosensitive ion channel [Candidatus ainarchaeum sp.]|nr:mechanosensitive ion channel [Candidatus ainarchaeum sp.]